jgi:nitrite reductase (NO-forming)
VDLPGSAPGPVVRVTQGDTVRFTLHNASTAMQHSIDFHAAQTPWDKNYQPVDPGKTLSFDWVARFPGVFMYHCGTPPVIQHISNGMYGAIVVEPSRALAKAREYVLVQSEFYPSAKATNGIYYGDYNAMLADQPGYVVFNGVANQYKDHPLVARPGELVRIWIVDAGPSHWSAFHVIGALFENAYLDGNPFNVQHGLQTVTVRPAAATWSSCRSRMPGAYPFVSHSFADAVKGDLGVIKVSDDAPGASTQGFDTKCLAAPAGTPFTVKFTNEDTGIPHNFVVYTDSSATTRLGGATSAGAVITGPFATTYRFPALQPGQYFFRCDLHPMVMTGTFIVAAGH